MEKPSKKVVLIAIHIVFQLALLVYIWINVDWSVAIFLFWLSISLASFNDKIIKWGNGLKGRLDEVSQNQDRNAHEFNIFVGTINQQATALKKEMNICRECEQHGAHGIRPGSIHNKNAENCLLKDSKVFS